MINHENVMREIVCIVERIGLEPTFSTVTLVVCIRHGGYLSICIPTGIRIRMLAVKGQNPNQLDDRDIMRRVKESNSQPLSWHSFQD